MKFLRHVFAFWGLSLALALAPIAPPSSAEEGWHVQVPLGPAEALPHLRLADDPPRLLVDRREVPGDADDRPKLAGATEGPLRPGWRRSQLPLPAPMQLAASHMHQGANGARQLSLALAPVPRAAPVLAAPVRVVIDPGHGGRDPGATAGGLREADLVLDLALRLERALEGTPGMALRLTRRTDRFVPLAERGGVGPGPWALISLHADARPGQPAQGPAIYTPRGETPLATALAHALVAEGLAEAPVPILQAPFVVFERAEGAAALVEIGFLTDAGDQARLSHPAWRQFMALALARGLRGWAAGLDQPSTSAAAN